MDGRKNTDICGGGAAAHDVYLYGMVVRTHAFLLGGNYPEPDSYNEIKQKFSYPGGETGMAATVLASLGCKVKMDGNHQGYNTADIISGFYGGIGVDASPLLYDPEYEGLEDYIIIDRDTRTIFGQFAAYFNDYYQKGRARWNTPSGGDIKAAKAAGIDPFFDKQSLLAARLCREHGVPFVTIDEKPGSEICRLASIIAVSGEYIRDHIPEYHGRKALLLQKYAESTEALVILTGGGDAAVYGRNGQAKEFSAYKVDTVSTLGAGDTFKAGCVYALLNGYDDDETVSFASACAAVACTRFPLHLNPPSLSEISALRKAAGR